MLVFLTGGTGFVGARLAEALRRRGHRLVCTTRDPGGEAAQAAPGADRCRWVRADFACDFDPAAWRARVGSADVVINAVGILRERGGQTFDALHVAAPTALFAACAEAGVRRVIQVSALGADRHARSRYHVSKREADDFLAGLPLDWTIVQPSLVYGAGGASARLFDLLASLPVTPLPGRGLQRVQPIHVDDAVAAIVALVEGGTHVGERIALVGPRPATLRAFLADLRRGLRLGEPRFVPVPMAAMRLAASIGRRIPGGFLDPETLDMLVRGNTADDRATRSLLGGPARDPSAFVAPTAADAAGRLAALEWLLPLLRLAVAAVWITAGVVSLGPYPVEQSYALLARAGVGATLQPPMLYGAALLDLALGVATLWPRRPRALWWFQIALVLMYTAVITLRLPEFWLHPYGPVVKNLPFLAALWMLAVLDRGGRR
jgi:uncharacterized protein YbjT (DUF2867 family)